MADSSDFPVCMVCASPITSKKKYQIHESEQGVTLGGKLYRLESQLPANPKGHVCHRCYQANTKAQHRAMYNHGLDPEMQPPAPKRPRKVPNARAVVVPPETCTITQHAVAGLANLVISSCSECNTQWLHITHNSVDKQHCEFFFTCTNGHEMKWSSDDQQTVIPASNSVQSQGEVSQGDEVVVGNGYGHAR